MGSLGIQCTTKNSIIGLDFVSMFKKKSRSVCLLLIIKTFYLKKYLHFYHTIFSIQDMYFETRVYTAGMLDAPQYFPKEVTPIM